MKHTRIHLFNRHSFAVTLLSLLLLVCLTGCSLTGTGGAGNSAGSVSGSTSNTTGTSEAQTGSTASFPAELTAADDSFSFIWLSDTQYYCSDYPEIFQTMSGWITANASSMNAAVVLHTGDLVDDGSDETQWSTAVSCMSAIAAQLPCVVLPGNNDVVSKGNDEYQAFDSYFGKGSDATGTDGMLYCGDGASRALPLTAGGMQFILIALAWDADETTFAWANQILAQYADSTGIILTHDYLNKDIQRSDNGEAVFQAVVKPNANVKLVLCGHKSTAGLLSSDIDDNGDGTSDRTVLQLIADYQNETKGGDGFLRVLTFTPSAQKLTIRTYSPYTGTMNCYDADVDSYELSTAGW